MGAHGRTFDLEERSRVEGEIVVGKDKFCELEEESCECLGVGRALVQEMFQGQRAWVWGMLVYREETSTVAMMESGGRGGDFS